MILTRFYKFLEIILRTVMMQLSVIMDVSFVLIINTMTFCQYLMYYTLPLKEEVSYIKPIKCSKLDPVSIFS